MAFWSDQENSLEPLRQHRWYIIFNKDNGEFNATEARYALKSCTKPEYKIETSEHYLINEVFRYPKRAAWQPITITFVSTRYTNQLSLASDIFSLLNKSNFQERIDQQGIISKGISKKDSVFDSLKIVQINPNEQDIETWDLKYPFITGAKFGNLSYENENLVEISIDITYDYAQYYIGNSNTSEDVLPDPAKKNSASLVEKFADFLTTQLNNAGIPTF
jgi:hypothetical protein